MKIMVGMPNNCVAVYILQ